MGKFDRWIDIQKSPRTINNWRLVEEELVERGESLHRQVSYLTAKNALESVMSSIPNGVEYRDLRDTLELVEIGVSKKGKESAYAIYAPSRGRRVRKLDVSRTAIYVRAKKKLMRAAEDVQLLEDTGPWTADTIPFWPNKKEAIVIQRKVTKREADKIADKQKKALPGILSKLKEMGRRIKRKRPGEPGHVGRKQKPIPDVSMQALELEFGAEGKRARPVFRNAVRAARDGAGRLPASNPIIIKTMTDPNTRSYKRFPPRIRKIPSSKAAEFKGFQQRIR